MTIETLHEGLKNIFGTAALSTALALGSGTAQAQDNAKSPTNTLPPIVSSINKKIINIDIIAKIESSNNPNATNPSGAKGLCQLKQGAWSDVQAHHPELSKYSFEKYWNDADINKQFGDIYYNETLPTYLKRLKLPINLNTILAVYNFGIGNVKKLIKKYGNESWENHLPKETKDYIQKYNINLNKS